MSDNINSPRNVVLCFDGTSNTFGKTHTNVLRLASALDHDPTRQIFYYDPGVGTLPEPRYVSGAGKRLSELCGLAFGTGLTQNVEKAYSFLMDVWQPQDKVFIFGFSRGAYTARVLAGLLHAVGLLPRGNVNLVPHAMSYYKAVRHGTKEKPSPYWVDLDQLRETAARDSGTSDGRLPTHMVGVWDTVSSVGWIWDQLSFPFTATNESVAHIRHAISIDERRCFFRQNRFTAAENRDLKEYWFAGSHGDVGGGYSDNEQAAWRVAFDWMVEEAVALGLRIDPKRLAIILGTSSGHQDHWTDKIHDQLNIQKAWWIPEYLPKLRYESTTHSRKIVFGMGSPRQLRKGDKIHRSALLRVRETDYVPAQFSKAFLEQIRGISDVPDYLEFPG